MVVVTIKTESNQKAQIPNMFCTRVSHYPDIGRGLTNRSATCNGDRRRRKPESRHINVTLTI